MEQDSKLHYTDFAKSVKEKYPEYKDVDDRVLAEKLIEKYPTYGEKVYFDEVNPEKKNLNETSEQPVAESANTSEETGSGTPSGSQPTQSEYSQGGTSYEDFQSNVSALASHFLTNISGGGGQQVQAKRGIALVDENNNVRKYDSAKQAQEELTPEELSKMRTVEDTRHESEKESDIFAFQGKPVQQELLKEQEEASKDATVTQKPLDINDKRVRKARIESASQESLKINESSTREEKLDLALNMKDLYPFLNPVIVGEDGNMHPTEDFDKGVALSRMESLYNDAEANRQFSNEVDGYKDAPALLKMISTATVATAGMAYDFAGLVSSIPRRLIDSPKEGEIEQFFSDSKEWTDKKMMAYKMSSNISQEDMEKGYHNLMAEDFGKGAKLFGYQMGEALASMAVILAAPELRFAGAGSEIASVNAARKGMSGVLKSTAEQLGTKVNTGVAMLAASEANNEYARAIDNGMSPLQASLGASAKAAVTYVTEHMFMGAEKRFADVLNGRSVNQAKKEFKEKVEEVLEDFVKEGYLEEGTQNLSSQLVDYIAEGKEISVSQFFDESHLGGALSLGSFTAQKVASVPSVIMTNKEIRDKRILLAQLEEEWRQAETEQEREAIQKAVNTARVELKKSNDELAEDLETLSPEERKEYVDISREIVDKVRMLEGAKSEGWQSVLKQEIQEAEDKRQAIFDKNAEQRAKKIEGIKQQQKNDEVSESEATTEANKEVTNQEVTKPKEALEKGRKDITGLTDELIEASIKGNDTDGIISTRAERTIPIVQAKLELGMDVYDKSQEDRVLDYAKKKTEELGGDWVKVKPVIVKAMDEAKAVQSAYVNNRAGDTQGFFSDVVSGKSDKYKPSKKYDYELEFSEEEDKFKEEYDKHKGEFDEHIATSIPNFRDVQVKKGSAIVEILPDGGLVYDIGGSEGGFAKTITKTSGGKVRSINLDPNPDMQRVHEAKPVDGAEFIPEAFQEGFDEFKAHEPKEKADVVHESMVFQFINKERASKVQEVKDKYLKDDGIFITEEKFSLKDKEAQKENEKIKNENFKSRFYTDKQLKSKGEEVLVGMHHNQAVYEEYIEELKKEFKYVETYWTSGNFRGIVASNNKASVDSFLEKLGGVQNNYTYSNKVDYIEVDFVETKNGKEFSDYQKRAISKRKSDRMQVELISEDEANSIVENGGKLFIAKDGSAGAYVKHDGYMGGLFKDPTSSKNKAAKVLQDIRVKAGGKFFDAFGTHLEDIYIKNGFKPVARMPFNEEYAPDGWQETNLSKKLDNVFFVYDPNHKSKKGDGKVISDYDKAYEYAKNYSAENNSEQKQDYVEISDEAGIRKLNSDVENTNKRQTIRAARNASNAIRKLFPNVKIHLYKDSKSYNEAVNPDSNIAEFGEFDPNTNTISINLETTSLESIKGAETVAHEVFHAMLYNVLTGGKSGVKTDTTAPSERLLGSLISAIKDDGSPAVKAIAAKMSIIKGAVEGGHYLKEDEAEEVLANIAEILSSDNYGKLKLNTRTKVRNIINKFLRVIGLGKLQLKNDNDVINFFNTVPQKVVEGKVLEVEDTEVLEHLKDGLISAPVASSEVQSPKKSRVKDIIIKDGGHNLSLVKKGDLIDIEALIKDIEAKGEKVWFWVADQLGKGEYTDSHNGTKHYLDAGLSFALDPKNKAKGAIWASGLPNKRMEKLISENDYLFIISGSPQVSKLFNKKVYDVFTERLGNFKEFKDELMANKPVKAIKETIGKHASWKSLRDDASAEHGRKKFLQAVIASKNTPNSALAKAIQVRGGHIDINDLRDGFLVDNNFEQNDIMIVLKPTGVGGKSEHSTYLTDVLGEVVGVPDKKINAADITSGAIAEKLKDLNRSQSSQVIAPYGVGNKRVVTSEKISKKKSIDAKTEAAKTKEMFAKERAAIDAYKKQSQDSTTIKLKKLFTDRQAGIRSKLVELNAIAAEAAMTTKAGATVLADKKFKQVEKKIYEKLTEQEEELMDAILFHERVIQIDKNFEARANEKEYEALYWESEADAVEGTKPKTAEKYRKKAEKIRNSIKEAPQHPSGYNAERSALALEGLREEHGEESYDKAYEAAQKVFEQFNGIMEKMYENGLINEDTYERFKQDKYLPRQFLHHLFSHEIVHQKEGNGLRSTQIKAIEDGSEELAFSDSRILLNSAMRSLANRIHQNEANKALFKALNKSGEQGWLRTANYQTNKKGEVKEDSFGNKVVKKADRGFVNVNVFEDGRRDAFQMDERLHNEWMDLNRSIEPSAAKFVRMVLGVGLLKRFATGYNPSFFLSNVPMDYMNVILFTDVYDGVPTSVAAADLAARFAKMSAAVSVMKGKEIVGVSKEDVKGVQSLLEEATENGLLMEFLTIYGKPEDISKRNEKKREGVVKKAARGGVQATKDVLSFSGEVSELAMRLAVYEKAKQTLTKNNNGEFTAKEIKLIAAAKARKTIDFHQGGTLTKQIDYFVPYFNAAMQGFRVAAAYSAKNPARLGAKLLEASVAVAALALLNMSFADDDDWDKISDYEKNAYFIVFLPQKDEDGNRAYMRIRKNPQAAVILNAMEAGVYAGLNKVMDRKFGSHDDIPSRLYDSANDALPFPVKLADMPSKMPPTVQGLFAYFSNYDPFRQQEIARDKGVVSSEKEGFYDKYVPLFYKEIGEYTGASPARLKAAAEKSVTTPSTNAVLGLVYSGLDNIVKASDASGKYDNISSKYLGLSGVGSSLVSKVHKNTNPRISSGTLSKKMDEAKLKVGWEKVQAKQEVKALIDNGAKPKEVMKFIKESDKVSETLKQPTADWAKGYYKTKKFKTEMPSYYTYLDIMYSESPEASAAALVVFLGGAKFKSPEYIEAVKNMKKLGFNHSERFAKAYNNKVKNK